jgi:hypothetical protein
MEIALFWLHARLGTVCPRIRRRRVRAAEPLIWMASVDSGDAKELMAAIPVTATVEAYAPVLWDMSIAILDLIATFGVGAAALWAAQRERAAMISPSGAPPADADGENDEGAFQRVSGSFADRARHQRRRRR